MPQMSPMLWILLANFFLGFYFLVKTNKNYSPMSALIKEKQISTFNKAIKW